MRFFIDSADTEKIRFVLNHYPCDGVTTNPTILARETNTPGPTLYAIREIIGNRLLFVQAISRECEDICREAETAREKLGEPLSVKIPAGTPEAYRAMKILADKGFSVTGTAVYTPQQALLCARSGADFVAPYVSHIDNMCVDSYTVLKEMAELIAKSGEKTVILAASFRTVEQVHRAMLAGAEAVTITPEMFELLAKSSGTNAEMGSFDKNWKTKFGEAKLFDIL